MKKNPQLIFFASWLQFSCVKSDTVSGVQAHLSLSHHELILEDDLAFFKTRHKVKRELS